MISGNNLPDTFSLLGGITLSFAEASFCIVGRAGEKEKESAKGRGDDGKEDEEPIILIIKADHSFVRLRRLDPVIL